MRRPLLPAIPAVLGLLVGLAAWAGAPVWSLAIAHLVVMALTWLAFRKLPGGGRLVAWRAGAIAGALPVLGPLAAWLAHPATARLGDLADEYRQFIAYDVAERSRPIVEDADEAIRRELSVTPLVEVLYHGDLAAKQDAAAKLAETQGASGVAVLREALAAPHDETRLFASLALLRTEEGHTAALAEARKGAAIDVARAARRYAESGLPSGPALAELWREAATAADAAAEIARRSTTGPLLAVVDPDALAERAEALGILARARRALGERDAALAAAQAAVDAAPADVEALAALAELLYEAGELDQLVALAPRMHAAAKAGSTFEQIAAYWLPPKTPEVRA